MLLGHRSMVAKAWERIVTVRTRFRGAPDSKGQTLVFGTERGAASTAALRRRTYLKAGAMCQAPWHFLNFLPEPHQHGSLRPMFSRSDLTIGRGAPAVEVVPPVIAIVAEPAAALPPAAAIASAPASD